MKKHSILTALLIGTSPLLFAETNALIEVKLFKGWVIKGECGFGNLAIKNTGTAPILLAKDAFTFSSFQLHARSFPNKRAEYGESEIESDYQMLRSMEEFEFFNLLPGETHVYEGRKFLLPARAPFSEEMRFIVSIYLGKGFWLDSEPLTVKGVVPDSIEHVTTLTDVNGSRDLVTVTYKNERWLYTKLGGYYTDFPLSLTNKIRVEPHEAKGHYKIWDGDKPIVFDLLQSLIREGPDENNVLGKWTRERKQKAEADNAEVRRKKAEQQ